MGLYGKPDTEYVPQTDPYPPLPRSREAWELLRGDDGLMVDMLRARLPWWERDDPIEGEAFLTPEERETIERVSSALRVARGLR